MWNTMVEMYSEPDPEMFPLYLFSPVTRHSFSLPVHLNQGGRKCMLGERAEVTGKYIDQLWPPSPSLHPVRRRDASPLSFRSGSLTLSNQTRSLSPSYLVPDWMSLKREGSPTGFIPPRFSDTSSWVSCYRVVQLFSNPSPPMLLAGLSMIWHVFISCLSLHSILLFVFVFHLNMQMWLVCISVDKDDWLTDKNKTLTLE